MNELSSIELPCEFYDAPEAQSIPAAQTLAVAALQAEISAFVIRGNDWHRMAAEAGPDPSYAIFAKALGSAVLRRNINYSFDGRQPCDAHVDEVPEVLLGLKHEGLFNVHRVIAGAVTSCATHTRPGYYTQDVESRIPNAGFNFGITQDLIRRRLINTFTSETSIAEARLTADDRIVFFERTSPTVDGLPNVIHLFHRGTPDRLSVIDQYYAKRDV